MKKWNMMLLALALLMLPAAGLAQDGELIQEEPLAQKLTPDLPELFTEVYASLSEGLEQGAALAMDAMEQELTLTLHTDSERVEEGKRVCLTVTAGNPTARAANVTITLKLPERLQTTEETTWEAVLAPAQLDAQSGELVPSVSTFTRELTLAAGGESVDAMIESEMSMGTRFYRAQTPIALCVPDVHVSASVDGAQDHRVRAGDAVAYRVAVVNSGAAAKDVSLEMVLPEAVALSEPLPEGFTLSGHTLSGQLHAEAAGETPWSTELVLEAKVNENALDGDEDARRLMAATLRADGEPIPVPRVEVCGAKISARLLAESDSLETGEETTLSVVVVNSGLAAADVRLSCMLPEGLELIGEEEQEDAENEAEAAPVLDGGNGDLPMGGAAVPAEPAADAQMAMTEADRTLVFDMHMEPAKEGADGTIANTQVLEIPVKASLPQDKLTEQLLGTSLAWSVDEAQAELGGAVAMRVYRPTFLGISGDDWSGVFWAGVLLLVTVTCLCAAAHRDKKEEDYCFE